MKKNILIGSIAGLVITPIPLLLAMASSGAGHGHYLWARLLYPFTMLSTYLTGSIATFVLLLSCLQFIAYGGLVGAGLMSRRWAMVAFAVAIFHIVCACWLVLFPPPSFS